MNIPSHPNLNRLVKIKLLPLYLAICILTMLGGCGDRVRSHGHVINENELKQIDIGKTTKTDLLQVFGRPSFDGAFNDQKLYYSSQVMVQPPAGVKQTRERIIYIFTLNSENVLEKIDIINKEDGLVIAHIDDKTPTPGASYGLMEQIITNLKRRRPSESE